MPRWKAVAIAASIVLLFLVVNRGAYKGYFQDDDLDNLAWNSQLDAVDYLNGLVSPVFSRNNFRPVGHFYFHVMERLAGLRFAPYVAVLQFFHLANCFLVWLILRRLKMHPLAALTAALFFLYHPVRSTLTGSRCTCSMCFVARFACSRFWRSSTGDGC